jgi:hypothetical protein
MRTVLRNSAHALLFCAVALSAACSSGGTADTPEPTPSGGAATPATGSLSIRVINNHSSGETLRVHLAPEAGQQTFIGNVAAGATLNWPFTATRGRYRLVAEREAGALVNSPSFNAQLPGVYVWDITLNRVDRRDR